MAEQGEKATPKRMATGMDAWLPTALGVLGAAVRPGTRSQLRVVAFIRCGSRCGSRINALTPGVLTENVAIFRLPLNPLCCAYGACPNSPSRLQGGSLSLQVNTRSDLAFDQQTPHVDLVHARMCCGQRRC
ncbi:unnamed protein product [Lampetra planeri]